MAPFEKDYKLEFDHSSDEHEGVNETIHTGIVHHHAKHASVHPVHAGSLSGLTSAVHVWTISDSTWRGIIFFGLPTCLPSSAYPFFLPMFANYVKFS